MEETDSNKEIGNAAESKFKVWLDKHNIPYLYIQQDEDTFSKAFNSYPAGKRPDFMILIPNFGFIFVDVKYRKINSNYGTFPIDIIETKKYSSLQRKFNLQIWFVFSNDEVNYQTWFWIPVSKVLEHGLPVKISSKSKQEFFAVPINSFIQISDNDSLERLFSRLFS